MSLSHIWSLAQLAGSLMCLVLVSFIVIFILTFMGQQKTVNDSYLAAKKQAEPVRAGVEYFLLQNGVSPVSCLGTFLVWNLRRLCHMCQVCHIGKGQTLRQG